MSVLRGAIRRTRLLRCDYYYDDVPPTAIEVFAARAVTAFSNLGPPAKQKVDKHEHLSHYSAVGYWSVFSIRQRYTILLKNQTDPAIADFFYEKWLHAWVGDAPSYNYWMCTSMAMGCMVAILSRHWFFNPDLYGRRQENKKPMPDRHRQWSYSLPYFNHRMRNMCTKFKFAFIDNEPDYSDIHPVGYRPNRKQIHRRPYSWVYTIPRYTCEDPLYTSTLHGHMNHLYEEIGYTKKAKSDDED